MGRKAYEIFESSVCYKCGGKGHIYGYSHVAGGVCFACNGAGYKFTKQGQADYDRWRAAVDVATIRPVTELQAGAFAKVNNSFPKYYQVESITSGNSSVGYGVKDAQGNVTFEYPPVYIVRFTREVRYSSGCALGMISQQEFEVLTDATIRIHPGAGNMPKADDYVAASSALK